MTRYLHIIFKVVYRFGTIQQVVHHFSLQVVFKTSVTCLVEKVLLQPFLWLSAFELIFVNLRKYLTHTPLAFWSGVT